MEKIHNPRPETELFLLEATDQMNAFYEEHQEFPSDWHRLEITFAGGPFRLGDPHTEPTIEDGNAWKPRDCEYTYIIEHADQSSFRITAVDSNGKIVAATEKTVGARE